MTHTHTQSPGGLDAEGRREPPLPADDPAIFDLDLRGLRHHWAARARPAADLGGSMMGADRRAQALGYPGAPPDGARRHGGGGGGQGAGRGPRTMGDRPDRVLCGPGNNGGDGYVVARRLALHGANVVVAVVASDTRPKGPSAVRNWDRIAQDEGITKVHLSVARDVAMFGQGIEKAAVLVDALLGTGVRGALRDPVRSAVELINKARAGGVPVVAVDTPTAVDLSSGEPSDPAVLADLTVTFHRPKTGLLTKRGAAHAGKVLVAPIGIPPDADRG